MQYKSLHTIFYTMSYDNELPINPDMYEEIQNTNDIRYFEQFNSLFSSNKIANYKVNKLPFENEIIETKKSYLNLHVNNERFIFPIDQIKLYDLKKFKTAIFAVTIINTYIEDFTMLSRHLDKNTSYGLADEFEYISINSKKIATKECIDETANILLNNLFFDGKATNLRMVLGRKNYHMFSIVDQELSNLCKDITKDENYGTKIATSEFVNTTVGIKTYSEFEESIYDKWQDTGSLYFVNFTNFVQIVPQDGSDHSTSFMNSYDKMVILALFQKAMFVEFQTIEQKRNDIKSFNKFINQYYYLEISPESQLDTLYIMIQKGLKNVKYYDVLTSEIEIYAASINNRNMFMITFAYTLFALISIVLMLRG